MSTGSATIIKNAYVLTCDANNRGGRFSLAIRDGRIVGIEEDHELLAALHPQATVVDASGKLIVPGFINAHAHSYSMIMRERTERVPLAIWHQDLRLRELNSRLLKRESYDDIRSIYLAAYFSHLKSGTTRVCESGPEIDGDGLVCMLEAIARTDVKSNIVLQNWAQIERAREVSGSDRQFLVSLGRESDFTVYTFESLVRTARELDIPLSAHLAEQKEQVDAVRRNFQKNPIAVLGEFGALQPTTQILHGNHLTESDVSLLKQCNLGVVVSPRAAALKQTAYPALRMLAANNVKMCLGTDWGNVDMLREMQFSLQLPLLVPGMEPVGALEVLRMATINGASMLGIAAECGSIETGKRADMTFLDITDVRLAPLSQSDSPEAIATMLIRELSSHHVSDVMIDGEFYVTDGKLMTMAEEDIVAGLTATFERLLPRSGHTGKKEPSPENSVQLQRSFIPLLSSGGRAIRNVKQADNVLASPERRPAGPLDVSDKKGPTVDQSSERSEERLNVLPELSKNTRRVFGEDDEF